MLEDGKAYTSNSFETLTHLKGEQIRGVVRTQIVGHSGVLMVFESGFSLHLSSNGSHWIEGKEETSRILKNVKDKLQAAKHELETVAEIAGIGEKNIRIGDKVKVIGPDNDGNLKWRSIEFTVMKSLPNGLFGDGGRIWFSSGSLKKV